MVNTISLSFTASWENINDLLNMNLPAGTYTFPQMLFKVHRTYGVTEGHGFPYHTQVDRNIVAPLYINVKIVVEPSMGEVNMPTALPIDVALVNDNTLTGRGSVLATVTGTFGKNLKIIPRSINNGMLIREGQAQNERGIPYLLSVQPVSGDNIRRTLIDGHDGGAVTLGVQLPILGQLSMHQLRFDANFDSPTSGLITGRYSDNVTLLFTTDDI
jgi:hypothetical protein